ncbi:ABC transporter ATP-binding protein [Serratia sp. DD3]|uniref:ABC transporter ATP-binding protein n=1 Tax=Serratia sp. DD3 TaxID=1410619 RepID=UPI0003C50DBE|nr:sn-glycerol-3-phosphate ABC transporter ATP-binding protein UgpC [Serratia sp. DD3]KEY57922.1 sn-glycerol-3-phosphate import ATP-binding protein UgpC [Serratia sp. DD3]
MAQVKLTQITKIYSNGFQAIQNLNLTINDGEFMVVVGPSGCAKSTLLRMIAGLEASSAGDIEIGHQRVNDLPPKDRGIAMVFQNYALYPHMSVYENMAFGLRQQKIDQIEIKRRIEHSAEMLDITHLLKSKPGEISGGQRQRVALGRAIVRKPKVFLFDEPLSNLDAKLRMTTRSHIAQLHRNLQAEGQQATMIYVTHDQVEAMTLGDRICVLNHGKVMQVDTPLRLYQYPANRFVAGFIGSPAMNMFQVQPVIDHGDIKLNLSSGETLTLPKEKAEQWGDRGTQNVWLSIRPEHITYHESEPAVRENAITAVLESVEVMGNENYLYLRHGAERIVVRSLCYPSTAKLAGHPVTLIFDMNQCHLFDAQTEQSLFD